MASTKAIIEHVGMVDGMNRSARAHLVPMTDWWTQVGMRVQDGRLVQIPRKKTLNNAAPGLGPVTAIEVVPITGTTNSFVYVFAEETISMLRSRAVFEAVEYDADPLVQSEERWATTLFEGQIHFTNLFNPLKYISREQRVKQYDEEQPAARYVVTYFDHLIVANVNYKGLFPYRVQWSQLREFGKWTPGRSSEADYYDLLEETNPFHAGITGMAKLNDRVILYTSSNIYATTYTGMPRVMRTDPLVEGVGCDFPHGVANVADKFHFFVSRKWRNFFMMSGDGTPQPIGDKIISYFLEDISTDEEEQVKLWTYVDTQASEVWWVYPAKTPFAGTTQKAVIFNFKTQKWYAAYVEDVFSFCPKANIGFSVEDYVGTQCQNLTGTCGELTSRHVTLGKLWGGDGGTILEEAVLGDDVTPTTNYLITETGGKILLIGDSDALTLVQSQVLVPCGKPYLETGDHTYGWFETEKEVETITPQAVLGNAAGLQVYVNHRDNLDDTIAWDTISQKWTPTIREKRLSLPRVNGRVIRYKFEPVTGVAGAIGFEWSMFAENVYNIKQDVEK